MALQKSMESETGSGVWGNYLKITSINLDKMQGKLRVVLALFLDAAHKNGTPIKKAVVVGAYNISSAEYGDDLFAIAYTKIKDAEYPVLDGAIDV